MKNKYVNPGPRIGFAYDPIGDGKWAIRGGYGIFFEHMNGNEAIGSLEGNPSPLVSNGGVGTITGYPNVGLQAQGAPSPFMATSTPNQADWPYMQQWNLGVQHQFPAQLVASVAYVGSKGTHLTRQYDLNQLQPLPPSENPFLASGAPITSTDCGGFASGVPYVNQGLPTSAILANGTTITGRRSRTFSLPADILLRLTTVPIRVSATSRALEPLPTRSTTPCRPLCAALLAT